MKKEIINYLSNIKDAAKSTLESIKSNIKRGAVKAGATALTAAMLATGTGCGSENSLGDLFEQIGGVVDDIGDTIGNVLPGNDEPATNDNSEHIPEYKTLEQIQQEGRPVTYDDLIKALTYLCWVNADRGASVMKDFYGDEFEYTVVEFVSITPKEFVYKDENKERFQIEAPCYYTNYSGNYFPIRLDYIQFIGKYTIPRATYYEIPLNLSKVLDVVAEKFTIEEKHVEEPIKYGYCNYLIDREGYDGVVLDTDLISTITNEEAVTAGLEAVVSLIELEKQREPEFQSGLTE